MRELVALEELEVAQPVKKFLVPSQLQAWGKPHVGVGDCLFQALGEDANHGTSLHGRS
jgi:hypothetical protein